MKIVLGTRNQHKIKEFKEEFAKINIEVVGLDEYLGNTEVPEPIEDGKTFQENSIIKAKYYYNLVKVPCLCDDSGLCVEALDGAAQVNLNADTANRGKNTFNYAYYSITFRESQKIVIGTNQYNRNRTTQYTVNGAFSDYKFAYMPLDLTQYECSYNGVAKFYRDLLVSRSKGRLSVDGDKTTTPALDLEILGSLILALLITNV